MSALGDALSAQTVSQVNNLKALSSDSKVNALVSLQSKLTSEIGSASTSVGGVSYSGWNDDVATKMSGHSDTLKDTVYPKIATDVGGGSNLQMLITQVRLLNTKCEEYGRVYSQRESISVSSSLSDEKLAANRAKRDRLAGTLREIVSEINTVLANISKIKFLGDSAGFETDFAEHDTSADMPDDSADTPDDTSSGGLKYYDFGFAGMYANNPYILGYQYGEYDSAEQCYEFKDPDSASLSSRTDEASEHRKETTYDRSEYQRAVDEHRDIILDDGAELEFDGGYLWGLIGRDYYNSNSCITMFAYDSSTGKYRKVSSVDADGTYHFDSRDSGRSVSEMRNAVYK